MVTPDKIRNDAAKADALLEAFERSFLHLVDVGDEAPDEREREVGTMAFYGPPGYAPEDHRRTGGTERPHGGLRRGVCSQ